MSKTEIELKEELVLRKAQIEGMTIRIRNIENEKREYLQVIAAICYSEGGVSISDRTMAMFQRDVNIEISKDVINRQTILRLGKSRSK